MHGHRSLRSPTLRPDAGLSFPVHQGDDARFFILAGTFVGEGALLRFYVVHCAAFPLAIGFLMAVHFWRVCQGTVLHAKGCHGLLDPTTRFHLCREWI